MRENKFDWQEVHSRLAKTELAIQQESFLSVNESKKLLKARAQKLAISSKANAANEAVLEVIEFMLANERYAIESSFVREVYPLKELTPLPCVPAFILGIVNIRGEVISVIDIKRFFELPITGLTDLNKAIVLSSDKMTFGILADEIVGTRNILNADIQPPLSTLTGIREAYLYGIASNHTAVLDASKLLTDKNLLIDETVD